MSREPGTYARFTTNQGTFVVKLFDDVAPKTVANFVGLAEGTKAWKDPVSGQSVTRPFYDGLTFHRVIDGFMIQGGCPMGNGMGGPGYRFEDEFSPTARHSRAGILSMANAGPGTNGSQFFITHTATPWLDGKHTVFGEIIGAEDKKVVDAVRMGDKIERVSIEGDVVALLAAKADRIAEWNRTLDAAKG